MKKGNKIAQNMVYLREQVSRMTQEEFADSMNTKRANISAYEKGGITPKLELLTKLTQHYRISLETLMEVDLSALTVQEFAQLQNKMQEKSFIPKVVLADTEGKERIVFVPFKAAAGYFKGCEDELFMKDMPHFHVPHPAFQNGSFRAFEISGNSMLPIKNGDIVIATPLESVNQVKPNEMYVIVANEGIVLKRIQFTDIVSEIILKSDNPDYEPYSIEIGDIKEIWKVAWSLSMV